MIKLLALMIFALSSSGMAANCIDVSGNYKVDGGVFTLDQKDCSQITMTAKDTSGNVIGGEVRVTDGVTRLRDQDKPTKYFGYLSSTLTQDGWIEYWTYFSNGSLSILRTVSTLDNQGNLVIHEYFIPQEGATEIDNGIIIDQRVP